MLTADNQIEQERGKQPDSRAVLSVVEPTYVCVLLAMLFQMLIDFITDLYNLNCWIIWV